MEPVIVWYLRLSVSYFAAGALFGVVILLWPSESGYYIPLHVHLNLLGFMAMMIYGVGYHILPRFSGRQVYSSSIVKIQFWLANAGLAGMIIAWPFVMRDIIPAFFNPLLVISGICSAAAAVLFAANVLKTIKPA